MPKLAAIVLGLVALAYAAFGVQWLANPAGMAEPLGISLANGDATSDARAVYGGLELGLGIFFLYSAWAPARHSQGLAAAALSLGGLGSARLFGILAAASPVSGATYQLFGTDLAGTIVCTAVLFAHRRGQKTNV